MFEEEKPDGIYAVYMTSVGGQGFAMFLFSGGIITGSDPLGVFFDGRYEVNQNGYSVKITVGVPPNADVIQGASAGPQGMSYEVNTVLPVTFWELPVIAVQTPLGDVNARFERLRPIN